MQRSNRSRLWRQCTATYTLSSDAEDAQHDKSRCYVRDTSVVLQLYSAERGVLSFEQKRAMIQNMSSVLYVGSLGSSEMVSRIDYMQTAFQSVCHSADIRFESPPNRSAFWTSLELSSALLCSQNALIRTERVTLDIIARVSTAYHERYVTNLAFRCYGHSTGCLEVAAANRLRACEACDSSGAKREDTIADHPLWAWRGTAHIVRTRDSRSIGTHLNTSYTCFRSVARFSDPSVLSFELREVVKLEVSVKLESMLVGTMEDHTNEGLKGGTCGTAVRRRRVLGRRNQERDSLGGEALLGENVQEKRRVERCDSAFYIAAIPESEGLAEEDSTGCVEHIRVLLGRVWSDLEGSIADCCVFDGLELEDAKKYDGGHGGGNLCSHFNAFVRTTEKGGSRRRRGIEGLRATEE
nr:hypothetical protein Iba_chr11fCG3880 [Ipomoea batatas]